MHRSGECPGHQGRSIADRRIELGLDEVEGPGQVRTAEVGAAQIRADEVGESEVRTPQVSTEEQRAPEVGALEVRMDEHGTDEIRASSVCPDVIVTFPSVITPCSTVSFGVTIFPRTLPVCRRVAV